MKAYLHSFLLFGCLALFTHCGGDDGPGTPPPTEAELRVTILTAGTGKWTPPATGAVILGGGATAQDITSLFENFTITFTPTGYTTTGTTPVWARSGTWSFTDDTGTKFRREDGLEVTLVDISATALKFTLEWDQTTTSGRQQSLKGLHTFTLNK